MRELATTISELINKKREGDYWDFKIGPHDNCASLLHDILCLANSLHRGNKYLIIGIADADCNYDIVGLTKGQQNRKNQADLIDFLRAINFAGECRPEVELVTIEIDGKEIDIVTILDSQLKPYWLTKEYRHKTVFVRANHIYTRTGDTNTPIDKSADLYHVEKMWFQRFGFDLTPMERFKNLLLKPEEWFKDIGNIRYSYHKMFPEFRIEFTEPQSMWEPYCEFYKNTLAYMGNALFKYQGNELFKLVYIYCDEMRIILAEPMTKLVRCGNRQDWFYCYDLSDIDGMFLQFLRPESLGFYSPVDFSSRGGNAPFLVFDNEDSIKQFILYLEGHQTELDSITVDPVPRPFGQEYRSAISLEFLSKAKQMYYNLGITPHRPYRM